MKKIKLLLVLICMTAILSCNSRRVLVVADPVPELFLKEQTPFYKIDRFFIYASCGFLPEFQENSSGIDHQSIQEKINSGKYSSLITNSLDYYDLDIPKDMKTVLIGGSREIRYPDAVHIVTSNTLAMKRLGNVLSVEWKEKGKLPVMVIWENLRAGESDLETLLTVWDENERHVLNENALVLRATDHDVQNRIESFLRGYDFSEQQAVLVGACAPVMDIFLNALPVDEHIELILSIPDNPDLPDSVIGIVSPAFRNVLKASANALKEYSPGDIIEIQNIYKNK